MTRSIAIAPSLVVSIIGGSTGAGRLIIIASVRILCLPCFDYIYIKSLIKLNKVVINVCINIVHADDTVI